MKKKPDHSPFHSAKEEVDQKKAQKHKPGAPAYTLAFQDPDFLLSEELRPVRIQLELLRPEMELQNQNIEHAVVFFGSARLPEPEIAEKQLADAEEALAKAPDDEKKQYELRRARRIMANSQYLPEATRLANLVSSDQNSNFFVITGGGPSFMAAANKGAYEAGCRSIALNMILPNEQDPNEFVTPELTFQFHYFAIRKMHFLMRAKALAAFPGGFGTMDELFEVLTLLQTQKIDRIPLLLFNEEFWRNIINFEGLVEEGTISPENLDLFSYVETADEAWAKIKAFYDL